ncbi:hypothetical protein [Acetobacter sp.]|uniref:hypothetical protein n=1 Tax=Acetobacter sp. TaxID=440 RepID=UPI0039E7EDFB
MRKTSLIISLLICLSGAAWGQSAPQPIGPNGLPVPIANGIKWTDAMWRDAFRAKADLHRHGGSDTGTDVSAAVSQADRGTVSRTNSERQGTTLQPQDFLSAGQTAAQLTSGQIDAEPAIAAAVAAGRAVTLPCGNYRLDEPFPDWSTDGVRLSGMNMQCVTLNVNYTINNGSINVFHLSGHGQIISDMTLNATQKMTAGCLIFEQYVSQNRIHDLIVTGPFYNGIYVYGSNNVHIDHIYARPPFLNSETIPDAQKGPAYAGGAFITLDGDPDSGKINIDTYLSDLNIAQYTYGISYLYSSGVFENGIDVVGALNAHIFSPSAGRNVNGLQILNVLGDTSYGANWYFPNSGGGVYEFMCASCWASSSYSDAGIAILNPNVSQIHWVNSTAVNNSKSGIYISGGRNIGWSGGAIEMNNTKLGSTDDASDVYLSDGNGTLDWISISGAFIGQGGIMKYQIGKTNQAPYAVDLASVPSTAHITLTGLQTFNHSIGQFNLPSTTTNIIQSGNQGN